MLSLKIVLNESSCDWILFCVKETVKNLIFALVSLCLSSSQGWHNVRLRFSRWWKQRWLWAILRNDSGKIFDALVVLAWDLQSALWTSTVIDKVALDRPIPDTSIKQLVCSVMLFADCIIRACFNALRIVYLSGQV